MRIYFAHAGNDKTTKGKSIRTLLANEGIPNGLYSYAFNSESQLNAWREMWDTCVLIHLADTTARLHGNKSVKELLPENDKREGLFSYAYQHQEEQWQDSWNLAMKIHLAGHTADTKMDAQVKNQSLNHLTTYADKKEIESTLSAVKDLRPRMIIDSGAFTAWSTGKPINPRDYAEWALAFDKRWRDKMASLVYMNLDVIGDQEGTWKNQKILESLGMQPIPIVTYGADKEHLIRAIENYPYFALGGLVPYSRQKKKLEQWLDYCFSFIIKHYKQTGVMPKVHLLGITTNWVLKRYPCYSSDSSSWVSCLRFGGGKAAGIEQIPRYKESEAAMVATIHVLTNEIKKYKQMEEEATKLWKKRGIEWESDENKN